MDDGEYVSSVNFHTGSYDSKGIDASVRGKVSEVSYSLSGRMFKSDEPDLSGNSVSSIRDNTATGRYGDRCWTCRTTVATSAPTTIPPTTAVFWAA